MSSKSILAIGLLLVLAAVGCAFARRSASSELHRNAYSVALVVLGLLAAFFMFFGAGTVMREMLSQPKFQSQFVTQERLASATSLSVLAR